jgi:hypothetical protein
MRSVLLLLAALAACTPAATPAPTPAPTPAVPGMRGELLNERWVKPDGNINWPPNNGFAIQPTVLVLLPGALIDRFGASTGTFFSPEGAPYGKRALPYVCLHQEYTVYRVLLPLPVWVGTAAPWFEQPGGATQIETDASAARLLQDGEITAVHHYAADIDSPERPCH